MIDREEFLELLETEFPGALAWMSEVFGGCGEGLLHLEMAAFRRLTEKAMDDGQFWLAERHFRFIDRILPLATPELSNAIDVSYVEDLALGEWTQKRYQAVKERMPPRLRAALIKISNTWK